MSRSPRRLALAGGSALLVLALSACGDTAVRSGAAAVVGETRITTEQLASLVEAGLADPQAGQQLGADRAAYQRDVLQRLISGEVLAVAAERNGVAVTPGQVQEQYDAIQDQLGGPEELRTQAAMAGLSLERVRDLARDQALSGALADRLVEDVDVPDEALDQAYEQGRDSFDQVRVAQVQLATLAEAQALLPRAQGLDDEAFAELARTTSTDEATRDRGGDLGLAPASAFAASELAAIGEAAFAAQPGATFAVQTERGGHVVRVLERETTSREEAEPQLRRALLEERRGAELNRVLRETADDLGVRVSPRFGNWDAEQQTVVERAQEPGRQLSTPAPGSEDATPAEPLAPQE